MKTQKSWLRDAKTVFDLGEDLNTLPCGHPDWDKRDRLYMERVLQPVPEPAVAEKYKSFFGYRMHDAFVLGITRDDRELRIRLHDRNVDNFVVSLCDILDIERMEGMWPVDLVFLKPQFVRGAVAGHKGRLRWADWRRLKTESLDYNTVDYLHDRTYREGELLLYVAEVWSFDPKAAKHLLVECQDAVVRDHRSKALAKAFSQAAAELWDIAWSLPQYPYSNEYEFLENAIAERKLELDMLRPRTAGT